jgi:hypothetical protein
MDAVSQKDTVRTGVFINSLYDLNIPEESFKIDMWLWCTYKDSSKKLYDLIEFPKTKDFSFTNQLIEQKNDYQWMTMRVAGEVINQWDTKNFPFDKQNLEVVLGFSFDTTTAKVIADINNCKLDPDFTIPNWKIDQVNFGDRSKKYNTTFGDPSIPNGFSVYPEFYASITLSREDGFATLLKLTMGLFIAFIVSCCVFFIKPTNTDPRFGLCVGGLFTAVGNKYITDSIIPSSNDLTLIDALHLVTFVYILIIIMLSVYSLYLTEKDTKKSILFSRKIDITSFIVMFISYFTIIGWFVYSAL